MSETYEIHIEGTVQGVGFRPFVYTLAARYALHGSVLNNAQGVVITLNATPDMLQKFLFDLHNELPPLAKIDKLKTAQIESKSLNGFEIITTQESGTRTARIPPDASICKECEAELFDPNNRRYGYPFISCTHCGVRYSIIYELPYDRDKTSMKFFKMCSACEKEYTNPLDRRYHAQPIGCWECGPALSWFEGAQEENLSQQEMIAQAIRRLEEGHIVAIKGVGGYHLMCDATSDEAVLKLRQRKQRPSKPFAVMVKDMQTAKRVAHIKTKEEALLSSKERPIVLLDAKASSLSHAVAPCIGRIGLFLPYTPLHLLLLKALDRPLVATSANITDEPICTTRESLKKLEGVYDYLLDHNREIVNGCDDSVVTVVADRTLILRRARGYAPVSIQLSKPLASKVLAAGANQKNTVAIGFEDQVILSPHIGDLDSIGSVAYYKNNIETLRRIYNFTPEVVAYDMHPNYESTKYARSLEGPNLLLRPVQHHYAHILGVMAEKGLHGKVLGVAFDGTGYGDDGKLWGGEFLVCDYRSYERAAHLNYFKLIGGEKAIKEPRRMALSLLFDLYGESALTLDLPTTNAFDVSELSNYYKAWEKSLGTVESSSAGRLFDAVASLLGVCQVMSYEGESGMLLEALYDGSITGSYPFTIEGGEINILPMLEVMLDEKEQKEAVSKFFHTMAEIIVTIKERYNDLPLVLGGGVFQNRVLTALILKRIPDAILSTAIPPNDGGIALGQIAHLPGDDA